MRAARKASSRRGRTKKWLPAGLAIAVLGFLGSGAVRAESGFAQFIGKFKARAVAEGIDPGVYDRLTAGLTADPLVPKRAASQPEFTTPIWAYLDQRVTASRIARGRAAFAANRALFDRIGQRYGVDPYLLAAIWGMETDYGAVLSNPRLIRPLVRVLFTLVYQERGRANEDAAELITAMRLIAQGRYTANSLVGSWAGAVGHTQIILSALARYGQDGDGDGRIDPDRSLADALATTAAYLKALGYVSGVDWGFEVSLPSGFDYLLADRTRLQPISFFAGKGVERVAGRRFPATDIPVFLYVPAGRKGPKFLMTGNYLVLKGYNFSDSYALAVAHLTDRLKGARPLVSSWPRATVFPNLAERKAVQLRLKQLGYYAGIVDGRIGPVTQAAYQLFQAARGEVADGFVTRDTYLQLETAH